MKLRFFFFVLLAACVPVAMALFISATAAVPAEVGIESRLTAAVASLQARLDADASKRRELLIRLATLSGVTDPLRDAANRGRAPSPELVAELRRATADLFKQSAPEVFAVATIQGAQVVVTAGEPRAMAIEDVPLATAALDGQLVHAFARFDGALFRFYALPVGVAEGAILVGDRVGDLTANRLREHAQVDHVSFVERSKDVLASSMPESERARAVASAERPRVSVSAERLGTGLVLPFGLDDVRPLRSLLDPLFPMLVPPGLYRSLAAELPGDVTLVATVSTRGALGWAGRLQALAFLMALGILAVGGLWASFIYGPIKRQSRSVEAHLARLQLDHSARLGTKGFSKVFIGLVTELNKVAEHLSGKPMQPAPVRETTKDPAPVPPKPLDLPLASSPATGSLLESTPDDFPFGEEPLARTGTDALDPPVPAPEPKSSVPADFATSRPPGVSAPAPAPKPAPPVQARPPVHERVVEGGNAQQAPVPLPAPRPVGATTQPKIAKPDPFAAFGPTPEPDDDDRTRQARIPEELLARTRKELSGAETRAETPADADERHFREVYAQFLDARRQTGEGVAGLTEDKFVERLRKNRDQLADRFGGLPVRFQVHVKDGKAALKASPQR